jgi:hypothetical protein
MKYSISFTDNDDITVSVSVCSDAASFARLSGISEVEFSDEDLSVSFLNSLQEMPKELHRLRLSILQNLANDASVRLQKIKNMATEK